eukprot:3931771-Lingulodinium_polyedra.AAC.1
MSAHMRDDSSYASVSLDATSEKRSRSQATTTRCARCKYRMVGLCPVSTTSIIAWLSSWTAS